MEQCVHLSLAQPLVHAKKPPPEHAQELHQLCSDGDVDEAHTTLVRSYVMCCNGILIVIENTKFLQLENHAHADCRTTHPVLLAGAATITRLLLPWRIVFILRFYAIIHFYKAIMVKKKIMPARIRRQRELV